MQWKTALFLAFAVSLGATLAVACSGESDADTSGYDLGSGSRCYAGSCEDATGPGADATRLPKDSGDGPASPDGAGSPESAPDAVGPTPDTTSPTPDVPGPGLDVVGPPPSDGPVLEADPAEALWFSYVPLTDLPVVRTVTVANTGGGELYITAVGIVGGASPDFRVTAVPDPTVPLREGDLATVEVTFTEVSQHPQEATLNIRSNDPVADPTWIRLVPQPKGDTPSPEPCLQVSPTLLDFGRVERGQLGTRIFTITNCGTAALSVREIKRGSVFFFPTSEEFQLQAPVQAPTIIAPGQSVSQAVTFEAGLAGPKTGFFSVMSDDPNADPVNGARVDVRALSAAPPPETQGLHIQLEWDSDNCDVDMHLLNPQGTFHQAPNDCFYGNMSPDWGTPGDITDDPFLDVDNVWGLGPENINFQEPQPGQYKLVIHYYRDSYNDSPSTDTNATVRVYVFGQLAATFGPTYLASTDWMWDVCTIDWPAQTITPLGAVYQR